MNIWGFSWRQARREWRAGELRTIAAALVVAGAALTAVSAFSQRIERGLLASATELLGADLVVRSRQVADQEWVAEAQRRGLRTASVVEFPSVAFAGDRSMLVEVKAVSAAYPLRGVLEIADQPFGQPYGAEGVPAVDQAWVDQRVVNELAAQMGGSLELGNLNLALRHTVVLEPDRAAGAFNLAPRVLISAGALEQSGLLGAGSRVRYRFLIAGDQANVDGFRQWLEPRLGANQYFQSIDDSQQQIATAMARAQRFLNLAALTAIILSGVAIVIAVAHFARRHFDTVAILRCLGEKQAPVLLSFALQLLWVGIPALLTGALIGYSGQFLLVAAMGDLLPGQLPLPDWRPGLLAIGIGLLVLLGYGIPPLLRLRHVPPMRVLNRVLGEPSARTIGAYLAAGLFSLGLIIWRAEDWRLGLAMAIGLAVTAGLLSLAGTLLSQLLRRLAAGRASWRLGLASASHGQTAQLQLAGLGLGMLAMLLLGVVQHDLLSGWRDSLPANTPNLFLINIQPDQVESTQTYFSQQAIESQGVFPMAVARLSRINGQSPRPEDFADPRAAGRIRGNINVSWSSEFPAANRLLRGQWWSGQGNEVSLAESWATTMELDLGDTITVRVGSDEVTATVTSIREVDWDSMEPNFFVLLSPDAVGDVARTYISSLYLPSNRLNDVSGLVRRHPNISVIDISAILNRVNSIIERVSQTVQLVFVLTLFAGILVLVAGLQGSLQQRQYAGAVLRTLGGSRRQLTASTLVEFGLLGVTAGLISALAAAAVGWGLASQVFDMPYQPSVLLLGLGALAGALMIVLVGYVGSRSVLTTPPAWVLRKS